MNTRQLAAIKAAIAVLEDDLARARIQQKRDPNWHASDGSSIDALIRECLRAIAELQENLPN